MAGERILDGLNDAQRQAVTHDAGPLLIVAGAGTGKTTAITRRIAWLIAQKKARPEEILALTFTDKAAAEMEERVDTLVQYGYADVEISTFHAFGDRILREHALEMGLQPDFRVLNRAEQVIFFRDRLFEFPLVHYRPLGDPTRHIRALITLVSRCKDEDITPEEYLAYVEQVAGEAAAAPDYEEARERIAQQRELAATYAKYQELMARDGCVDFGDQIVLVLKLLRARANVRAGLQRRFKYIMVDEFQDTNHAQFEVVKLLGARYGNVACVCDDDQAIYRWRGAAISNVLAFLDKYPEARQVVLTENYRSHQKILDSAYRLIVNNNPDRLEVRSGISKHLLAVREPDGPAPAHQHYETGTQEADAVAHAIREHVDAGRWRYDDVAILVRSNDDGDQFLRSLNLQGIPWTFSGNSGLYGRPEIRLLIAFLRSLVHVDESVSLHYLSSSERYLELGREMPTGELLYLFLKDSGWLGRMYREETARDVAESKNIAKFFDRVKSASKALRYDNVREFVKHLDELIDAGEDPAVAEADIETPAVRVLTIHKAKGLEFPVVFLVNLVQEKFPLRRRRDPLELPVALTKDAVPTGDYHLQEERRLFYVGMTRARQELFLTNASDYGGSRQRKTSLFVLEGLDLPREASRPFRVRPVEEIEHHAPSAEIEDPSLQPLAPDVELNLSHKQIDDYQTCPLKYFNVHVRRIPIRRHHAVAYGAVMHKVVEYYLRRRAVGNYTPLDDLLAIYERAWAGEDVIHDRPGSHEPAEGFLTREHEEARKAAGREALRRFWHHEEAEGTKPTWVEKEFGFALGPDRVRGRYDRVDEDLLGAVIVDYKTTEINRQKDADRRVAESLQLKMYALAWREMTGTLPQRVELRFTDSNLVGRRVPTAEDIDTAIDAVKAAAAGIRARRFDATPSWGACRHCAYNQICPYTATRD